MPEHVRRDADVGGSREEAVDLLASRRERHRAVENGDAARMQSIHLPGEREHRAAAERDDDRARRQRPERPLADELERELPLEDLQLVLGERALDERERIDGAEKEDLAVLAGEQQPRPGGAALRVVGPLHLVEHEELARVRRHLHRRADDRRALVDPLLAGDEPDVLGSDPLAEPSVRLLGEHPERPGVDAGALVGELARAPRTSSRSSSGRGARRRARARMPRDGSETVIRFSAACTACAGRRRARLERLGRFCLPRGGRRRAHRRTVASGRPAALDRPKRAGSGEASGPSRSRRWRARP